MWRLVGYALGVGSLLLVGCVGPMRSIGGPAPREGYFTGAEGVRLFFRAEGDGADTVVVLHGMGVGMSYLAPDLQPLVRGRTLLFYDQRGFGRSDLVSDSARLLLAHHVADLERLRQHLGSERISLLGHSWGGLLAGAYAASHPERVDRILLLDPSIPARVLLPGVEERSQRLMHEREDTARIARMNALWQTWEDADHPATCHEFYALAIQTWFQTEESARRSRGQFCGAPAEAIRNSARIYRYSFLATFSENWDIRPRLGAVRAPILVVYGESGVLGEASRAWAEAFPNARLLGVPDAGHYLHVDRPKVFFPAADRFFRGGWPAGAERIDHRRGERGDARLGD